MNKWKSGEIAVNKTTTDTFKRANVYANSVPTNDPIREQQQHRDAKNTK